MRNVTVCFLVLHYRNIEIKHTSLILAYKSIAWKTALLCDFVASSVVTKPVVFKAN